ncbi:MAG: acyl-ACP--UDP-N-acetylglucosamine O-acyltransferase [Deltaproteobacteria bacterium]|nr:acyl-ACP--UDP-N-acetylglucosamine O-acyltransferase [Deltaproteobacteria bacterium]
MARVLVHPTAVVDRHAELDEGVEVGPFCVIGPAVRIGAETRLLGHVVVSGMTTLGRRNVVHPFTTLGGEAQMKKGLRKGVVEGERSLDERRRLVIGDDNVIRENVTVNVSALEEATRIGNTNLLMAGSHVAHDVVLGSHCVVANAVQIAGHCVVEDWVTFGGLAGLAQHVRVGESAFVAAGAMCERDVAPFVIVQGDRARVRALNVVGLGRRGVDATSLRALKAAFAKVYGAGHEPLAVALASLDRSDPWVDRFARGLSLHA